MTKQTTEETPWFQFDKEGAGFDQGKVAANTTEDSNWFAPDRESSGPDQGKAWVKPEKENKD